MVSVSGSADMVATARYPLDKKLKYTCCNDNHCHKLQYGVIIGGHDDMVGLVVIVCAGMR